MIGNYLMLYSGVSQETRAQSGIALITDHKWTSLITSYSSVNDHTITLCLKTNRGHITTIGVYALEDGRKKKRGASTNKYKKKLTNIIKVAV